MKFQPILILYTRRLLQVFRFWDPQILGGIAHRQVAEAQPPPHDRGRFGGVDNHFHPIGRPPLVEKSHNLGPKYVSARGYERHQFLHCGQVDNIVLQQPGFILLLGVLLADGDIASRNDAINGALVEPRNALEEGFGRLIDIEPAGNLVRRVDRQVLHELRQIGIPGALFVGESRLDRHAAILGWPFRLIFFFLVRVGNLCFDAN